MSLVRAISAPLGLPDPQKPDIAATRWRIVADFDAGRYFFDSLHAPSVFWVDLPKLDLRPRAAPPGTIGLLQSIDTRDVT